MKCTFLQAEIIILSITDRKSMYMVDTGLGVGYIQENSDCMALRKRNWLTYHFIYSLVTVSRKFLWQPGIYQQHCRDVVHVLFFCDEGAQQSPK